MQNRKQQQLEAYLAERDPQRKVALGRALVGNAAENLSPARREQRERMGLVNNHSSISVQGNRLVVSVCGEGAR
jgi:hypothetical protein